MGQLAPLHIVRFRENVTADAYLEVSRMIEARRPSVGGGLYSC
jgi:hypothetical protein